MIMRSFNFKFNH